MTWHTPGPWVFGDTKDSSAGRREPRDIDYLKRTGSAETLALYGRGESLAGPVVLALDPKRYDVFPGEADARLIEAAPEMYEAIRAAQNRIGSVLLKFQGQERADLLDVLKILRGAVGKAVGA